MIRTRTERVRQRKHRHQVMLRLLMLAVVPPLLSGVLFWAMTQVKGDVESSVATPVEPSAVSQSRRERVAHDARPDSRGPAAQVATPDAKPFVREVRESGLTVVDLSSSGSRGDVVEPAVLATRREESTREQTLVGVFESPMPLHGHNRVDDAVFEKLFKLGIQPAGLCSDEVFLRRVYIDVTGTLPRAHEAKAFLRDNDERKRAKLIDELLQRDEYADYWAMKWCDVLRVKAEFPINLWPNAAQAYHRWIRTAIRDNMPYDQFVREMLTSSGSNFRTPQVNFYRAMQSKEPEAIAKTVALTFMASRAEKWPPEKLAGMSQFFASVGFKPTGEWKEEIIYFDRRQGDSGNGPRKGMLPTGRVIEIPPNTDPRFVFTDWLVNENNPWFARAIANRTWFWLFGRGIVNPPDDVRADNPATNQELLNSLADELVSSGYDMKGLLRLILRSSAYQLSCVDPSGDEHAASYFASYMPRRHDAEVLIDAICQITGTTETYMSIIPEPFTFLPDRQRAISIPDGSITSSFLEIFGRPPRDTGMHSERNNQLTAGQSLHLLNSNHIRDKLKKGRGLANITKRSINTTQKAEQIYLTILSRYPTEDEMLIANTWCQDVEGTRELAWALINTDEFLFQH